MLQSFASLIFALLLLSACSDNATVNLYEKNLPKEKISCLNLVVFPPNDELEKSFEKLYKFDASCRYRLEVSTKSGITCNSNHNYQIKATGAFPTSYLKMQLNEGKSIIYSYYIDLQESVSEEDIQRAMLRLEEDLSL